MAQKRLEKKLKWEIDTKLKQFKEKGGGSRHKAKLEGTDQKAVFAWETYRTYHKHLRYFCKWCLNNPGPDGVPRSIDECKAYAPAWIESMKNRGLSTSTVTMCASALVKMYQCSREALGIDGLIDAQRRADIKRSRGEAVRDKNFNEALPRNNDLATFCRCTGLRRGELGQIRGTDLFEKDGVYYLAVTRNTKGGRHRISEIVGTDDEIRRAVDLCHASGGSKIFPKPNSNADIHGYRAEYAMRVYKKYARRKKDYRNERLIVHNNKVVCSYISKTGQADVDKFSHLYTGRITKKGVPEMIKGYRDVPSAFYCRRDLKGVYYDRQALFIASQNLGHNRESVIVEHYLWT